MDTFNHFIIIRELLIYPTKKKIFYKIQQFGLLGLILHNLQEF